MYTAQNDTVRPKRYSTLQMTDETHPGSMSHLGGVGPPMAITQCQQPKLIEAAASPISSLDHGAAKKGLRSTAVGGDQEELRSSGWST